ncbi:DNA-directed RNA polymerase III subunit RPC9 [Halotydeus destructor]|nr:DNA-directed RNA polymerase III subunit RPC9 [Halotydeus destructor]
MEVLNDNDALLSNNEVLNLLREPRSKKDEPKNLATIRYETVKYLEDLPCKYQNNEIVRNFLIQFKEKGFRLTKAEKLEILNHRPASTVELQLLIEESEERFSEEAMNHMLELIQLTLPSENESEEAHMEEAGQSTPDGAINSSNNKSDL